MQVLEIIFLIGPLDRTKKMGRPWQERLYYCKLKAFRNIFRATVLPNEPTFGTHTVPKVGSLES